MRRHLSFVVAGSLAIAGLSFGCDPADPATPPAEPGAGEVVPGDTAPPPPADPVTPAPPPETGTP